MGKNYWFPLEWDTWLADEALSCCSLEAQGLWIRCLCFMYRSGVAELTGTIEQLRRKLGVLPEELMRCLQELKTNNAADVRFCKDEVSIVSRRRQRDLKAKESNRLYVAKSREKNASKVDVSTHNKSKSKSNKKEEEKEVVKTPPHTATEHELSNFEYPVKDLILAFPNERFTPSQIGFIEADVLDTPVDREAWADTITLYVQNHDPATRSYVPTRTGTLLEVFKKKKKEITTNGTRKSHGKRTDQEAFAESRDFYANYDSQHTA